MHLLPTCEDWIHSSVPAIHDPSTGAATMVGAPAMDSWIGAGMPLSGPAQSRQAGVGTLMMASHWWLPIGGFRWKCLSMPANLSNAK
jgi:hypothetical protein